MLKKIAVSVATVATAGLMLGIAPPADAAPPEKIRICHFPGHQLATPFEVNENGQTYTVDGDYVTLAETPEEDAAAFCEEKGGEIIHVAEPAVTRGHDADLQHRIAGYQS